MYCCHGEIEYGEGENVWNFWASKQLHKEYTWIQVRKVLLYDWRISHRTSSLTKQNSINWIWWSIEHITKLSPIYSMYCHTQTAWKLNIIFAESDNILLTQVMHPYYIYSRTTCNNLQVYTFQCCSRKFQERKRGNPNGDLLVTCGYIWKNGVL